MRCRTITRIITFECTTCKTTQTRKYDTGNHLCDPCYRKDHYTRNRALRLQQAKQWSLANPEKVRTSKRQHYERNRAQQAQRRKAYVAQHPDRVRAYKQRFFARHYNSDVSFKLAHLLRSRTWKALKGVDRPRGFEDLLGCSFGQLRLYLENYFPLYPGMNWANYGSAWHVDHFLPLSSFDLSDPNQLQEACHYTNLQPLWARENIAKKDRLPIQ